ncbi:hypothetical protein GCM10011575_30380 [Microlunatus endophyticus]|uniref:Uncharacterized protein n=1 Tax=Microlunatus endophyticus TaxID=1716077 RepID=A0A917W6H8_9ACTN|nr:hypothetical protein [Microlunatus endophyticus]GGL69762.1 hypothetical protein GCM10011575_30380 [Microlunatus endophyticus]
MDEATDPWEDAPAELAGYWHEGDARWGRWAWQILASAGTVPTMLDETHPNYTDHLITAAALVHLGNSFTVCESIDDLEPPELSELISDIALGRHAERLGLHSEHWPETRYDLGAVIVCDRMPTVAKALAREIGMSRLYADLWAQRIEHGGYPLADHLMYDILNSVTSDKMIAWEWLSALAGHVEQSDRFSPSR